MLLANIAHCVYGQPFIYHGLIPFGTFVETYNYTATSGAYTNHANRPLRRMNS